MDPPTPPFPGLGVKSSGEPAEPSPSAAAGVFKHNDWELSALAGESCAVTLPDPELRHSVQLERGESGSQRQAAHCEKGVPTRDSASVT